MTRKPPSDLRLVRNDAPSAERGDAPDRRRSPAALPTPVPVDWDDQAPASPAELEEARRLSDAIERGEDPLAMALKAALRPPALDDTDHEALLVRALGDGDAPPTRAERRAADGLREGLEGGSAGEGRALAELAGALRAAWSPAPLPELRHRALIERALGVSMDRRPRRIAPVTMAALSTLAAVAAGVMLLFSRGRWLDAPPAPMAASPAPHVREHSAMFSARSTVALFDPATPFPRKGGQTARIDRIAAVRAGELRANRYAAWGVR